MVDSLLMKQLNSAPRDVLVAVAFGEDRTESRQEALSMICKFLALDSSRFLNQTVKSRLRNNGFTLNY